MASVSIVIGLPAQATDLSRTQESFTADLSRFLNVQTVGLLQQRSANTDCELNTTHEINAASLKTLTSQAPQTISAEPQVNPAPKAVTMILSPAFKRPARAHSSRRVGMVAADVLPYF